MRTAPLPGFQNNLDLFNTPEDSARLDPVTDSHLNALPMRAPSFFQTQNTRSKKRLPARGLIVTLVIVALVTVSIFFAFYH